VIVCFVDVGEIDDHHCNLITFFYIDDDIKDVLKIKRGVGELTLKNKIL
jgi:hypothetical protein